MAVNPLVWTPPPAVHVNQAARNLQEEANSWIQAAENRTVTNETEEVRVLRIENTRVRLNALVEISNRRLANPLTFPGTENVNEGLLQTGHALRVQAWGHLNSMGQPYNGSTLLNMFTARLAQNNW